MSKEQNEEIKKAEKPVEPKAPEKKAAPVKPSPYFSGVLADMETLLLQAGVKPAEEAKAVALGFAKRPELAVQLASLAGRAKRG